MLIPSSVPARADEMTETQRRELGGYFERCAAHENSCCDPLLFALVLSGEKPAAEITAAAFAFPDHRWAPHRGLFALCDLFGLSYRRIGHGTGSTWFVAPTGGRLDLLPSSELTARNRAWHRRLGVILGYPPDAVDYFIETDGEQRTRPLTLLERGVFSPEELAYTQFVFYVPKTSTTGYEQAIETGKAVRKQLSELAETWRLPELDEIATELYNDALRRLDEPIGVANQ